MADAIFYHEDFYRQIELVPEENYFAAGKFIDDLPPKENSIYGFSNISVRPEQKTHLLDRKIAIDEIKNILTPISLSYSENVTTGYGQSSWKDKNSVVWGFERYGIFAKQKGKFIEALWLSNSATFPQKNTGEHLTRAILQLSKQYSLILIDWDKEIICRLCFEDAVKEYLCQNLSFDWY
ncbi:MAG: hypothetical protein HZA79_16965 [Sphingobacteriales bacterium]|nr:hypothetical protein [Sphingobacteriales bacterium]